MFEWRKKFHEREYQKGQEAVAQEAAAHDYAERQILTRDALKAAAETINLANELAKDGDPHLQQLANIIKGSVVEAAVQATADGSPQVRRDGLEAPPFSVSSPGNSLPSATSSSDSTPKGLPQGPEKRPPGRPRKDGQPPQKRKGD